MASANAGIALVHVAIQRSDAIGDARVDFRHRQQHVLPGRLDSAIGARAAQTTAYFRAGAVASWKRERLPLCPRSIGNRDQPFGSRRAIGNFNRRGTFGHQEATSSSRASCTRAVGAGSAFSSSSSRNQHRASYCRLDSSRPRSIMRRETTDCAGSNRFRLGVSAVADELVATPSIRNPMGSGTPEGGTSFEESRRVLTACARFRLHLQRWFPRRPRSADPL